MTTTDHQGRGGVWSPGCSCPSCRRIDEHLDRLVAEAPPLSDAKADRLAALLTSHR